MLVLIDDFIGSGTTAVECCEVFLNNISHLKNDSVIIVTIAAMSIGIQHIENELKIRTYSNIVQQRGITDFFNENVAQRKKDIMKRQELLVYAPNSCPDEYSLGFKASEALITFMDKTPNNTFPVFWYETNSKIAPFPRYKNFR